MHVAYSIELTLVHIGQPASPRFIAFYGGTHGYPEFCHLRDNDVVVLRLVAVHINAVVELRERFSVRESEAANQSPSSMTQGGHGN